MLLGWAARPGRWRALAERRGELPEVKLPERLRGAVWLERREGSSVAVVGWAPGWWRVAQVETDPRVAAEIAPPGVPIASRDATGVGKSPPGSRAGWLPILARRWRRRYAASDPSALDEAAACFGRWRELLAGAELVRGPLRRDARAALARLASERLRAGRASRLDRLDGMVGEAPLWAEYERARAACQAYRQDHFDTWRRSPEYARLREWRVLAEETLARVVRRRPAPSPLALVAGLGVYVRRDWLTDALSASRAPTIELGLVRSAGGSWVCIKPQGGLGGDSAALLDLIRVEGLGEVA